MAARGSESKEKITSKILETFTGSFIYNKEIRIPIMEDGELIQIKCVLTCAKTNVENGDDTAIPGEISEVSAPEEAPAPKIATGPSEEEKANVQLLLQKLGLV